MGCRIIWNSPIHAVQHFMRICIFSNDIYRIFNQISHTEQTLTYNVNLAVTSTHILLDPVPKPTVKRSTTHAVAAVYLQGILNGSGITRGARARVPL